MAAVRIAALDEAAFFQAARRGDASAVLGAVVCHQGGVVDGGTYVQAHGPRFETKAEIRAFARLGGAVLGMTGAHEATLTKEAGLAFAALCMVDNVCHGLDDGGEKLSLEAFHAAQERNRALLEGAVARVVRALCAEAAAEAADAAEQRPGEQGAAAAPRGGAAARAELHC